MSGWHNRKHGPGKRGSRFPELCVLILFAVFSLLQGAAQTAHVPASDSLKKADAAFRAGYAAQQAGQLEAARAQFAEVVRLAPQIVEGREALGLVLLFGLGYQIW